jgi:rhamnose utilization protein RhaD (predicted bifunctional aldolase and dehydrogenase)
MTASQVNRLKTCGTRSAPPGMTEPEKLLYRSNLLGSDKRITNYGGGNTSAKVMQRDPLTGERSRCCGSRARAAISGP